MATKKNTVITANGKDYQYYRITKTIGHEYVNGVKKPIKKQFTGKSKLDAENKYKEWILSEVKEKNDNPRTYGELLDYFINEVLMVNSKYSIGTRKLYRSAYETYLKGRTLTKIQISRLSANDLQLFYNSLDVTKSTLETIHKVNISFSKWLLANRYSETSLCEGVVLPDKKVVKKQEDIVVWTDEELNIILNSEPNYYLLPLIKFAVYTGMRISELFGLKWSDINENIIHVRRQYYRGDLVNPKGNKEREIPLHPLLQEYVNTTEHSQEFVFTTKEGSLLEYHNVVHSINRFYDRIGIGHKKFHAYRATFVTNLCKKGVPIQIASKLAGHADISVTAKYYTSIDKDSMMDAISKL